MLRSEKKYNKSVVLLYHAVQPIGGALRHYPHGNRPHGKENEKIYKTDLSNNRFDEFYSLYVERERPQRNKNKPKMLFIADPPYLSTDVKYLINTINPLHFSYY